jgi:hypothetical protein
VGPTPKIVTAHPITNVSNPNLILSYDPWSIADYGLWTGLGAVVWTALLGWCTFFAMRDSVCGAAALLLVGWIAFNVMFHLVWGDEFFVYSAHWAWALFMLVLLGARRIRLPLLGAAVLLICVGQASALIMVREGVDQIFAAMKAGPG